MRTKPKMNKQDIAYVIHEVRNIPYYTNRVIELDDTLERLSDELDAVGSPHCPLGNTQPSGVGRPTASRMNEILSEEAYYIELRKHTNNCLILAMSLYDNIMNVCDGSNECGLVKDFANGVSYNRLMSDYHVTNVYLTVSRIVQRINY